MSRKNWSSWIIIGILVWIVLTCTLFVAHNKNMVEEAVEAAHATSSETEDSFEIWTLEGTMEDILEEVIPNYRKLYPNVKFKVKAFKSDIYDEMLMNAVRTNSLPDMFYSCGDKRLGELVQLDVVADITEEVTSQLSDKVYEDALIGYTVDGKIYGLPAFGWNNVLYCNTELFEECGLDYPTNYGELLEVVREFKKKGITPMIMGGQEADSSSLYYMELVLGKEDIKIVKGLGNNPKYFAMDGFSEAAKQFKQLIDLKPWQAGYETDSSSDAIRKFASGEGAMMVSGSWDSIKLDDIIHSKVKGKIKVMPFPRVHHADVGIAGYTDGFVLSKEALAKKEAKTLFMQLMKEISDRAVEKKGMGIPVYKDQSLENTRYDILKQCLSIFPKETTHETYSKMLSSSVARKYNYALLMFINGEMTSENFIKQLISAANN